MTVRVYRWDDSSAPVLSGTVGALTGVLDACLVNGYGAKSASGWAIEYTGTNKRVYRAPSGNRLRLRVEDNNGHSQGAAFAVCRGYETMSDVDTGVNPFPRVDQMAAAAPTVAKSSTADSTARPWIVVATQTGFHLWVGYALVAANALSASAAYQGSYFFGDIVSKKAGDAYGTVIAMNNTNGVGSMSGGGLSQAWTTIYGTYVARSYLQNPGPLPLAKIAGWEETGGSSFMGANSVATTSFPDLVSGGLRLAPVDVAELTTQANVYCVRGRIPGLWNPLANLPGNNGDTIDGSGDLAGKTFLLLDSGYGNNRARIALEISDTW